MDSLFYEFIINKENKKIIGIFELDILCLDFDGYRCWTYSAGDIISECHIEKDILFIVMLYESCQKVSLSTGKRLN